MWQIAPLSPTPPVLDSFSPKLHSKKLTLLVLSKRQYLSQSNHLLNYSKSYLSVNQHVWWVVRLSIAVWMEAVVLRHGSKTLQNSYSSGYMHLMGRSKAHTYTHTHTHTHTHTPHTHTQWFTSVLKTSKLAWYTVLLDRNQRCYNNAEPISWQCLCDNPHLIVSFVITTMLYQQYFSENQNA